MPRTAIPKLVTKDSLIRLLSDERKCAHVVGKALLAIKNRQTTDEIECQGTFIANGIGFSHADAEIGTSMASWYEKTGMLTTKQVAYWTKPIGKTGYPRISKYWRQLNAVAIEKKFGKDMV